MKRPHWRKLTWALVIWTGACAIWLIAGAASAGSQCASQGTHLATQGCEAGTTIGAGLILGFWFVIFVPMCLVWFMTRKQN